MCKPSLLTALTYRPLGVLSSDLFIFILNKSLDILSLGRVPKEERTVAHMREGAGIGTRVRFIVLISLANKDRGIELTTNGQSKADLKIDDILRSRERNREALVSDLDLHVSYSVG